MIGVLLVNLGTPEAPDAASVRTYLAEFLSDPRVIEIPRLLWQPILRGIILRTRPAKSARAYREVWTDDGSPLLAISMRQAAALRERFGSGIIIGLAFRCGKMSIGYAISKMVDAGVDRILFAPLYPQYCAATTASANDALFAQLESMRFQPAVRTLPPYFDDPLHIEALRANGGDDLDYRVYVSGDENAITAVAAAYGSAEVLDKEAFLGVMSSEIDTMLGLFYALLMLAVVIALLGIANTLALSIFERTRELGLLRAVGMARAQVRAAVRWESIIIAVFGTTLGLAIGTFFGWAIVKAMADQGIDTLTVPYTSLAVVTAIAGIAGAAAAVLPARRAAKLDVLHALVSE